MFGTSTSSLSIHEELFQLRQADRNIHKFTIYIRTLAASSGWNETALLSAYHRGLNPRLRQQMLIFEDAVGLESFLLKPQQVSQHLCAVSAEERTSDISPINNSPNHEAMQTDQHHLSATERQRRIRLKLCLYCGEEGHLHQTCPVRPPRPAVSTIQLNTAVLIHANQLFPVKILFDSVFFWKFPLFSPTVHLQYPTPKESYLLSDHDNSRKTAGQWAGALENSRVNTPYWLPAWGNIYLAGTGRIHRRCRPGAPVDGRTQAYH